MTTFLTVLVYFIFGAAGNACRILLSPTLPSFRNDLTWEPSRRLVVECLAGGVSGFVLPYFGAIFAPLVGLNASTVAGVPDYIKAGLMFILNFSGSFAVGEILARVKGGGGV